MHVVRCGCRVRGSYQHTSTLFQRCPGCGIREFQTKFCHFCCVAVVMDRNSRFGKRVDSTETKRADLN